MGRDFLSYSRFSEICEAIGEAHAEADLQRRQDLVTQGYWAYLFAPKGEDHVMPTLGDWLHSWGVGGDMPETDPYEGVKRFDRMFPGLLDKHRKPRKEG